MCVCVSMSEQGLGVCVCVSMSTQQGNVSV